MKIRRKLDYLFIYFPIYPKISQAVLDRWSKMYFGEADNGVFGHMTYRPGHCCKMLALNSINFKLI